MKHASNIQVFEFRVGNVLENQRRISFFIGEIEISCSAGGSTIATLTAIYIHSLILICKALRITTEAKYCTKWRIEVHPCWSRVGREILLRFEVMGTNYYAITKVDEVTKMSIKDAIDADDYGAAKSLMPKTIHIGKSSGGWHFLFNHNNWEFFEKTEASVQSFLNRCQIMDEYGRTVNHNDFWVMVETKKKLKPEMEYGVIADGLNFSNYTDFS